MEHRPLVSWGLARRVAVVAEGRPPRLTRPELERLVADLRITARRAGCLAAAHVGLDGGGARDIRVVDRPGWIRAARRMADGVVADLGLTERPAHLFNGARAAGNGLVVGVALGALSRRMLGQYDAFTGDDALYLVAPTIVEHERSRGFVPADFRLWIALHEQAHALQFRLAPWLRDHLRVLMLRLAADETRLADGLTGWLATRDAAALLTSPPARADLARLTATMTFLEGHADHVADSAGRGHVRTVAALRRAFQRPEGSLISRLSRSLDKGAQYRDGLAFCRTVQAQRGRRALTAAFREPAALPTAAEIADPPAWLARVDG